MGGTGFFAGSFDPPTLGHLDLVRRALTVVDRLVVGVGINTDKATWLDAERRCRLLAAIVPPEVEVVAFEGLAVDAARDARATVLLRGLRGSEDAAGELAMARANRRLRPGLETVLLASSPEVAHISSRLVREVFRSGGEVSLFVPAAVADDLANEARATPPAARSGGEERTDAEERTE